jgi:hypothetical protein
MASEKVTVTVVPTETPVAPADGVVDDTTGAVVSTVNMELKALARALPAKSFTPVVTRIVYCVPFVSAERGVIAAVFVAALYVTLTGTGVDEDVTSSCSVPPVPPAPAVMVV